MKLRSRTVAVEDRDTWAGLVDILLHPACEGCGSLQLLAAEPFYDEDDLPFDLEGGGSVLRIIPKPGFQKELLASSQDELLLIVDCPDDEGWLVPDDIVRDWLCRHVANEQLEDLLVAHPLYEYLTELDEDGLSRGGGRGDLVQWVPGMPELAVVTAPELLSPELDPEAPPANLDRRAYHDGLLDLLRQLDAAFDLEEVELGVRLRGSAARFAPPSS
ncbi:MAG: hypothetical protein ACPGQL_03480 [Thermoplasmatota archaeon]